MHALTYQMLLPLGVAIVTLVWLLDFCSKIYSSQFQQRFIIVGIGFPTLASPIINMIFITPYRNCFTISK
ncbi:hypothetical protein PRIPAC_82720, partial [Pristionchus pacificus]|uniref:G protein-coupled receptor n=1 Tax=Pristionchus pacificus TaxID=54126 RepID=A0A2A6CN57_PRIPA